LSLFAGKIAQKKALRFAKPLLFLTYLFVCALVQVIQIDYLHLSVLTDETNMRLSSKHCFWYLSNSNFDKLSVSDNSVNQYSLSLHSFNAISNLEIKSLVPCAY
jgi:hypothetical protein